MIQGRCGTSFPPKTIHSLVVSGKLFGEEFQRHRAAQAGVLGFVDDTHSTATQLLKDSKVRNGLSDHNTRNLLLAGHVRPGPLASQTKIIHVLGFCGHIPQKSVSAISSLSFGGYCADTFLGDMPTESPKKVSAQFPP